MRSVSCSGVRALAIGAATVGCRRSHASDTVATETPCAGRHLVERGEHALAVGVQIGRCAGGTRAVARFVLRAVLAGEEPLREGEVRQRRQAFALDERGEVALVVALDEVVVRLQHGEPRQAVPVRNGQCFGEPLGAVVGRAEVAHLARADQRVERRRASPRAGCPGRPGVRSRGRCGRSSGGAASPRPRPGCSSRTGPAGRPTCRPWSRRRRRPGCRARRASCRGSPRSRRPRRRGRRSPRSCRRPRCRRRARRRTAPRPPSSRRRCRRG